MPNYDIRRAMKSFVLRIILLAGLVVIVTNLAKLLMTWLLRSVISVDNIYLSSELEFLGTLIISLVLLLIIFLRAYQKRKRELTKLCDSIDRIASGDFDTKISYEKRDSMANIYSEINKMMTELKNLEFLHKDFINHFSHEFKTPIASINGFSSLMLEKELSEEDRRVYLEIIRDESERLSNLTNNTILLSKLSSLDYISDTEYYNLAEQLRQCVIILSNEWSAKSINFTGDFDDLSYLGNRELMQHLWLNLIGNSIKYTSSHGEINASLKKENNNAVIHIRDNGMGMDKDTLSHIFDPYYQSDKSRLNGLGLGMAIVKQIVSLCDGHIDIESVPGEGSEFIITLPLQ